MLEAVRDTQQLLADKEEELNGIRAEFEQKQKEVRWAPREFESSSGAGSGEWRPGLGRCF